MSTSAINSDRPFESWLDKNCDYKTRHVGSEPVPELGGEVYECDHWNFVCDDHDDGETPAIVVRVDHEERSNYMGVHLLNFDEAGEEEAMCFAGIFYDVESLESLLRVLVLANREF